MAEVPAEVWVGRAVVVTIGTNAQEDAAMPKVRFKNAVTLPAADEDGTLMLPALAYLGFWSMQRFPGTAVEGA